MLGESKHLHQMVDVLHSKHKQYADEIQSCIDNHSVDQLEIKRIAGTHFFLTLIAWLHGVLIVVFCSLKPNYFCIKSVIFNLNIFTTLF